MGAKAKALFRARFGGEELERIEKRIETALDIAIDEARGMDRFHALMNEQLRLVGRPPVHKQNIRYWKRTGAFLDREFWLPIEIASDMVTTRRTLRPDLYEYKLPYVPTGGSIDE